MGFSRQTSARSVNQSLDQSINQTEDQSSVQSRDQSTIELHTASLISSVCEMKQQTKQMQRKYHDYYYNTHTNTHTYAQVLNVGNRIRHQFPVQTEQRKHLLFGERKREQENEDDPQRPSERHSIRSTTIYDIVFFTNKRTSVLRTRRNVNDMTKVQNEHSKSAI